MQRRFFLKSAAVAAGASVPFSAFVERVESKNKP